MNISDNYLSLSVVLFSVTFLIAACGPTEEVTEEPPPPEPDPEAVPETVEDLLDETDIPFSAIESNEDVRDLLLQQEGWVEETLSDMTLEEKVAQMMVPRINSNYMSKDTERYQQVMEYVEDLGVGGITFFAGDVYELATLANDFQKKADIPLLISADFESGVSMRIRRATLFPVAMAVGATRDPGLAYRLARATALEGSALGIHQNFAPLADVNNNPDNPVINVRSFGEDPELVGEMAEAYTRGLHDGGMISTGKHFPGHGDTDMDSHVALPEIPHDRDRMEEIELKPFRHIINKGVMSMMSAHIAMPELAESPELPATLSRSIMTDLLREDLNFHGLIVTDAMDMHGIDLHYARDEAAVKAVQAGVDVVLLPPEPRMAIDAVVAAVRLGEIDKEQVDESVRRILSAKKLMGIHEQRELDIDKVRNIVGIDYHRDLAKDIATRSLTLVRNDDDMFPLDPQDDKEILSITLADRENQRMNIHSHNVSSTTEAIGSSFNRTLSDEFVNVTTAQLDPRSNEQEIDSLMAKAEEVDKIVLHSYAVARSGAGELDLPEHVDDALQDLANLDIQMGVVSFGDPYFISGVPDIDAYMAAWSANETTIQAVVETLKGENEPLGRLPIEIPGYGEIGDGLGYEEEIDEEDAPEFQPDDD